MKGISIAIFGFLTIGLAIAGLVWIQYNANSGIREKISSTENLIFLRMNEESEKVQSYVESSLGLSGSHALSTVAKSGGSRNNNTRYWQCTTPQVPQVDEMLVNINDKTLELLNSYISLIEEKSGSLLIDMKPMSCVNTEYSPDKNMIITRANGFDFRISDSNAFMSSKGAVIEKNIGSSNFWYDYAILKKWVENNEIKKIIEEKSNDGDIMPKGLSYESCSCSELQCPDAANVLNIVYPCWEESIKNVVENSVDEAIALLVNDNMYFGGKNLNCYPVIKCISAKEPVIVNKKTMTYESSGCCSASCTNCIRDACAVTTTEKICEGISTESICEKPDCEAKADYVPKKYCTVSRQTHGMAASGEYKQDAQEVCETCCAMSFGLIYDTGVDFTLICHDTSSIITTPHGIEPLRWEMNFFITAVSTAGADYKPNENSDCN